MFAHADTNGIQLDDAGVDGNDEDHSDAKRTVVPKQIVGKKRPGHHSSASNEDVVAQNSDGLEELQAKRARQDAKTNGVSEVLLLYIHPSSSS